ncbi:hypothetical protein [Streptomyces canus]|uniref:hypothetical protein n=1 Tax=Streptomyces canus TaxID=58343 RepID=UPI0037162B74
MGSPALSPPAGSRSTPPVERLGTAAFLRHGGAHGVFRPNEASVFPRAVGLAAIWDEGLVREVAEAASAELCAFKGEIGPCGERPR